MSIGFSRSHKASSKICPEGVTVFGVDEDEGGNMNDFREYKAAFDRKNSLMHKSIAKPKSSYFTLLNIGDLDQELENLANEDLDFRDDLYNAGNNPKMALKVIEKYKHEMSNKLYNALRTLYASPNRSAYDMPLAPTEVYNYGTGERIRYEYKKMNHPKKTASKSKKMHGGSGRRSR